MTKSICFVASARDYHAIDWYRTVRSICLTRRIIIATDLIESEGEPKLIDDDDEIYQLFNLDRWLLKRQSKLGNLWRNCLKLAAVPLSAHRLSAFAKKEEVIFHAHSMYYIFLCWLARVEFIATPMGSDVLVRPEQSRIYKFFATYSLKAAHTITVDSVALQEKIRHLCGRQSQLIQNGIDTEKTQILREQNRLRDKILSVRGMDPNYRIEEILLARNSSNKTMGIDLIFPFKETGYLELVKKQLTIKDKIHGRVDKNILYQFLSEAVAVFSIPVSDSSPRSVYEAIFCGTCVITTYGQWIELLPRCMRSRVLIVDIEKKDWFKNSIEKAKQIISTPFFPSSLAIEQFDEIESMKIVCKNFYGEIF